MLDWLFRRGKKGSDEKQQALVYGILSNPYMVSEDDKMLREQIGTNEVIIRDPQLLSLLETLRTIAAQNRELDFDIMALEGLVSHVIRTSILDPIDVSILTLKAQRILARIEMNMPEDFMEKGGINFLETIEMHVITALNDAMNGRKVKWMKVSPRQFEIRTGETGKQPRE